MTFEEWFAENFAGDDGAIFPGSFNVAKAAWQASREATIDECADVARGEFSEIVRAAIIKLKDKT